MSRRSLRRPGARSLAATLALGAAAMVGCGGEDGPAAVAPIPESDIVFESAAAGLPEIYLTDLAAGRPRRLLAPGLEARDPAPSPDGRRIAFVVANYDDGVGDIWVVGRDGQNPSRLTDHGALDDQPSWSPDGSRIAFRSYRSERLGEIWIMNADGSAPVNLTPAPAGTGIDHARPAWSPDGTRIAYAGTGGGDWGIWVMDADGGDKRQLTDTIELDTEPAWSPDGERIAFRRAGAGGLDLLIVAAQGGEPTPLALPGDQRQPAWSPDGAWIVCVSQPSAAAQPELAALRPDGSEVRPLTPDPSWGGGTNPAWIGR